METRNFDSWSSNYPSFLNSQQDDCERGLLSSSGRGRGVNEKEKQGMATVNNHVTKVSGSNEAATVDATSTPRVEQPVPVSGNKGIKGPVLTEHTRGLYRLLKSVGAVGKCFANSVYGFFLEKRMAYPVLEYYTPYANLLEEDMGNVPVWVKFHDVPITAFSKDGLSAIATKLDVLKNIKNSKQVVKGVQVGLKLRFKLAKKNYQPVSKRMVQVQVNNDDIGTNEGNSKLAEKGANSGVVSSTYRTSSAAF
nr:hypothetical protein [Tanacetum cinerariifolium]